MENARRNLCFGGVFLALGVAAAFAPAQAQDGGGLAPLTTAPETSISVGVGAVSGDSKERARFGMFNGLRTHDASGLLGFGYYNRDEAAGRWMSVEGRNLGLDNRELGYSYRRLGDLKFSIDYNEITRHDPRTINTSLQGAGTTTPTVSLLATPGTGQDLNLELKRKSIGLILEKQFGNFQIEVNFKNEDKNGARFWGKGFTCGAAYDTLGVCTAASGSQNAFLMLPEPVDSTIRQLDARLNYTGEKLKLSGGYYGSFYTNRNGSLTPTILGANKVNLNGVVEAWNAGLLNVMGYPMALWPDNQAHQFSLGGNYALTSHTRLNFKYVYTHATQHESFAGMGLTGGPVGRDNLGGVLNTTKAQLGFSSHPFAKVHLHGDVAYESKKNGTPIDVYNTHFDAATTTARTFTNGHPSPKKFDAKLEANYRLPGNYLLTGGVKYEHEDFGTWTSSDVAGGVNALRQKLDELGFRAELRKTMSETFTGAVAFSGDRRVGASSWLKPNSLPLTGVINASDQCLAAAGNACLVSRTGAVPFVYENRNRYKLRQTANWEPLERLSLQLFYDNGMDRFRGVTEEGLRYSKMNNLSLDAAYTLSDQWKLTAFLSRGNRTVDGGHSADYDSRLRDTATSLGLGFAGTPLGQLRVGGDLTAIHDKLVYRIVPDPFASTANVTLLQQTGGLPDVTYKLLRLKFYAEYALQKNATVRLDYIHNRTFFNEWTYNFNGTPFVYSDNTTLDAKQRQSVNFIGASYVYKFQ